MTVVGFCDWILSRVEILSHPRYNLALNPLPPTPTLPHPFPSVPDRSPNIPVMRYDSDSTLPEQGLFINGAPAHATSGEIFASVNPATNREICRVQAASQDDVNRAVAAARDAFSQWAKTPAAQRAKILLRAAEILRDRNDELARLETLDTGKPLCETTTTDIISGVEVLEYYAGVAPSVHGEHHDFPPSAFAIVRREPLGVCAGVGAWNYPIQIAMWKSAPALACGNTMVFKPAEVTPLSALKLAEVYSEAGMPDGVFNVVQGDARVGMMLSRHPGVDKVSLTGEAETGRAAMADAATTLKHVTFELGGKSPLVVFSDADLDGAVSAAMTANFLSSGQVCSNGTRVFVQEKVYEEFLSRIAPRVSAIRVGDPFEMETQTGPLVSAEHLRKVQSYVDDAMKSGARHVVGGERPRSEKLSAGNYITPALFADCDDGMKFVREEIFGPVLAALKFRDEDEAVARANATDYGLSGGVFTADFSRAHRVANALRAGSVWINDYNVTPPEVPFGGMKRSGLGRENGLETIRHYTQAKTIYANLDKAPDYF